jgi:hypothetical protein
MPNLFARLMPFIMIGIAIVAFAFGLVLLTYLFILGALIGIALFLINWMREKFFPNKKITPYNNAKKKGRTIDHQDR